VRARAALARAIWSKSGARRLPTGSELDRALTQLPPAELAWMCEFAPLGPLYLLPTRPFVKALARTLEELGAGRILEVAAGDGFLARALRQVSPRLEVVATDSGAWSRASARMSRRELHSLRGVAVPGVRAGADVLRMDARRAIREVAPDLVLCSWLPPGHMLDALIRAPVRHVLEIGAGSGVTASAWSWRFQHEFLEGALERHARCRLDARPGRTLHSKVTLYFGAAHPDFHEERVRRGDWLWQYRPQR
jgi:protein-L-isoaspartate O-methyltransferase